MPRGDRTGPLGQGAMTGRAAGHCAGYGVPGLANPFAGRGWRHGFHASGMPGGMRFGGNAAIQGGQAPYRNADPETERQAMKRQAGMLQSELERIQQRLAEIETQPTEE